MSQVSWKEVETGLRGRRAPVSQNDAESFRQDFKARVSLMRQDSAEEERVVPLSPFLKWSYATAALAAMAIIGLVLWPSRDTMLTQIKSLQVLAPHSGVIIMNDEDGRGTVVWITDMEPGDGNKG
ncbi:MAG: hypothetical protein WCO42_00595 [bacterium]